MPAIRQRFSLRPANCRTPRIRERPFADMAEVRGRINKSEKEITQLIESRRLRWAFNFATANEKVFLRVYKPAVEHWVNPMRPMPETFDELVRGLFPEATFLAGAVETISGTLFQETFNLSHHNMGGLLNAGLVLTQTEDWGGGVSPLILLPSVVGFLKGRQLS